MRHHTLTGLFKARWILQVCRKRECQHEKAGCSVNNSTAKLGILILYDYMYDLNCNIAGV
jgi:hypothetical protein